jgi:hypothetical protein
MGDEAAFEVVSVYADEGVVLKTIRCKIVKSMTPSDKI